MRAVDFGDEARLGKIPGGPKLRLTEQIAVHYCPHCGADLLALAENRATEFDAAAEASRHLVSAGGFLE